MSISRKSSDGPLGENSESAAAASDRESSELKEQKSAEPEEPSRSHSHSRSSRSSRRSSKRSQAGSKRPSMSVSASQPGRKSSLVLDDIPGRIITSRSDAPLTTYGATEEVPEVVDDGSPTVPLTPSSNKRKKGFFQSKGSFRSKRKSGSSTGSSFDANSDGASPVKYREAPTRSRSSSTESEDDESPYAALGPLTWRRFLKEVGFDLSKISFMVFVVALSGTLAYWLTPAAWLQTPAANLDHLQFEWDFSPVEAGFQQLHGTYDDFYDISAPGNNISQTPDNHFNAIIDFHSHTIFSDGSLTPSQTLDWHLAHGFNAMILTDHNQLTGALEVQKEARTPEYQDRILVLVGMEWTHCRGHYNFFFPEMTEEVVRDLENDVLIFTDPRDDSNVEVPFVSFPSDEQLQQAFDAVHSLGGLVQANHRWWSNRSLPPEGLPSDEDLVAWGVDFFEVANQQFLDIKQVQLAEQETGLGALTGTDMHTQFVNVYGWSVTRFSNWTEESFFEAVARENSIDILFDIVGSISEVSAAETAAPQGRGALMCSSVLSPRVFRTSVFMTPLIAVGSFIESIFYTYGGPDNYAFSFVEGSCGAPRTTTLHWDIIFISITWILLFYVFYKLWSFGVRALVIYVGIKWRERKKREDDVDTYKMTNVAAQSSTQSQST